MEAARTWGRGAYFWAKTLRGIEVAKAANKLLKPAEKRHLAQCNCHSAVIAACSFIWYLETSYKNVLEVGQHEKFETVVLRGVIKP